ncbi:hypothetical protein EG68_01474, partial [Paragonimus skrjabini miyazakii]
EPVSTRYSHKVFEIGVHLTHAIPPCGHSLATTLYTNLPRATRFRNSRVRLLQSRNQRFSIDFEMSKLQEMKELLSVLDTNKDNKVSVDELKAFLERNQGRLDRKRVEQFIAVHDKDKDGKLDLNEPASCLAGS